MKYLFLVQCVVFLVSTSVFGVAQDSPLQIELDAFLVTTTTTESGDSVERFSLAQEVFPGNVLCRFNHTQYLTGNASQDGIGINALTLSIDGSTTFAQAEGQTYIRESYS